MPFSALQLVETPVAIVGLDGLVRAANAAFVAWSPATRIGAPIAEGVPALALVDLAAVALASRALVIAAKGLGQGERVIPVEYRLRGVVSGEGRVICIEGRDLSRVHEKEQLLHSFSKVIDTNNRLLRRQKTAIAELLDNMRQAVFAVDASGRIVEPVSAFAKTIFGRELAGEQLVDTVLSSFDRQGEAFARIEAALVACFGEGDLQWHFSSPELPARVTYLRPAAETGEAPSPRTLRITYSPLWDDDANLERLLLVIEDVTAVERLSTQVATERATSVSNLERLQQMATIERTTLAGFFTDTRRRLGDAAACLQQIHSARTAVHELFRHVHTMKGNARSFQLSALSSAVHDAETLIVSLRDGSVSETDAAVQGIASGLARVDATLGEYEALARRVLGLAPADPPAAGSPVRIVPVVERELEALAELARRAGASPVSGTELAAAVARLGALPVAPLLARLEQVVGALAQSLDKRIAFESVGAELDLPREQLAPLADMLLHMVRNAVDHGVEYGEVRRAAGKPEVGRVSVRFVRHGAGTRVHVQDAGRGVDVDAMVAKALELALVGAEELAAMSAEARFALMCAPGVSTAEAVTELSGRGVGMDLVQTQVARLGGTLRIESVLGAGTEFVLELPLLARRSWGHSDAAGEGRHRLQEGD